MRNFELDRLRGVAIALTVMIHYTRIFFPWAVHPQYNHGAGIFNIWMNSWTGVDLFLVISGYIISKKLIETLESRAGNVESTISETKTFYLKRLFRIYPVAVTIFVFVLLCAIFFNKGGYFSSVENTIEAGVSIFTYTFNYYFAFGNYHGFPLSPYWSLSVEEQFYLFYPIFLLCCKTTKQRVIVLFSLLLLITFLVRPYSSFHSLFLTQTRCDGLIYGCLLYFLSRQSWYDQLVPKICENKYVSMAIFAFLTVVLAGFPGLGFSNNITIPVACALSTVLVMLSSFKKDIIISFLPIQRLLDYLGNRSYSLYLVHLPMFAVTQEVFFRLSHVYGFPLNSRLDVYYSIMALILVIIATELSFRCVETPFLKLGRKVMKGFKSSNVKPISTVGFTAYAD